MPINVPTQDDFNALLQRVETLENTPPPVSHPATTGTTSNPTEIHVAEFGASPANDDNYAEIQAAIDAAYLTDHKNVRIGAGTYKISQAINTSGVNIYSSGPLQGGVMRINNGQTAIRFSGEKDGVPRPGGSVRDMWVFAGPGTTGGIAIHLGSNGWYQPDRFDLSNLRITTGSLLPGQVAGTWSYAIYGLFTSRTSPPGLRGATMNNLEVMQCTSPAMVLWGINDLRMYNVNTYTGTGIQSMMGLWIGGTTGVPSTGVRIYGCDFEGPINVTNSHTCLFEGKFSGGVQYSGMAGQLPCIFWNNP